MKGADWINILAKSWPFKDIDWTTVLVLHTVVGFAKSKLFSISISQIQNVKKN